MGALSHKMTRNQTSFLDLVGGCRIFRGERWWGGEVRRWCHGEMVAPEEGGETCKRWSLEAAKGHRGGSL